LSEQPSKTKLSERFPKLCYAWLPVLLVAIDRISKVWVNTVLKEKECIPIIGNAVTFRYIENSGAAWGIFNNSVDVLTIASVLVIVGILFILKRVPSDKRFRPLLLTLLLIISGAFGNLYDRLVYHHVKDFISFDVIHFPVFNIADIYVTCATFLLVILLLFVYKEDELSFLPFFGGDTQNQSKKSDGDTESK